MRKQLLIIILFLSKFTFAQLTITSQQFPDSGTIYFSYVSTNNLSNFNPGPSGANVVWDFSNIQFNYSSHYYLYKQVAYQNLFKVEYSMGGYVSTKIFWHVDSMKYEYLGDTVHVSHPTYYDVITNYTNTKILMEAPFNYLDSYLDTFTYNSYSTSSGSVPDSGTGIITKEYDGYGEIRLPWGVYPNAARLHVTNYYADQSGAFVAITTGYEWYEQNSHDFILSCNIQNNSITQVQARTNFPVNTINELGNQNPLTIIPNPTTGKFYVDIPPGLSNEKDLSISIYDITGKCIMKNPIEQVSLSREILTPEFSTGIYIVELVNEKVRYKNKLVVY